MQNAAIRSESTQLAKPALVSKRENDPHLTAGIRSLATSMDSNFALPFGARIGWDGILGFVPGVGDLVTNSVSLSILVQAARLGCPPVILARMTGNILIDNLLDAIPFAGNFFDIYWKSNLRNVALLERYLDDPSRVIVRSKWLVGITLSAAIAMGLGFVILSVFAFFTFLRWLVFLLT